MHRYFITVNMLLLITLLIYLIKEEGRERHDDHDEDTKFS